MPRSPLFPLSGLVSVCAFAPITSHAQTAADLATVEQRLRSDILSSAPSPATVSGYQSTLQANGSWADITYSSTAQTNWGPLTHLDRLRVMCRAWAHPSGTQYQNATLLADILRAYDWWISDDPQSTNWYYNEIAVPQYLGQAMVLIKPQLSSTRKTSGLAFLQRAYVARSTNSGTNTGQNRVDRAIAGIQRGVVADSTSIAADAFLAIADTILVTTAEGIQRDGSYQQHGAQLYVQGYGSLYISNTLEWTAMGTGTGFAFSEAKRQILADYLLDGNRWMARGQVIDYTASGRGISRKSMSTTASPLGGLADSTKAVIPGYRTAELDALKASSAAANATGSADPALSLSGGKHFWRSDITTWHRPAAYSSVKISSTRTLQPETGNGEGLKNLHLADGVNLIYRTGNEYDDIMPAWNWYKLPGTTVEQGTYSLKPSADWGVAGTSTFAGGISDGTYAGTTFKYSRRNVAAKKSWFFFDEEFVALGADIDAPAATGQVETTLNQSLLNGAVTYSTGGSPLTLGPGTTSTAGLRWVHHDGTGYFFNQVPATAAIQSAAQSGTWQSLNTGYDATSVTKNVFALSIRHGTAFSDATYAYTVVPGLSGAQMAGYVNPIEILRNDATVQAARHRDSDVTQAAFYAAGSVTVEAGQTLASNSPSLVLLRREPSSLKLATSSPEAKAMTVQLQCEGLKLTGDSSWFDAFGKSSTVSVGLPGGDLAGSTAGLQLTSDGAASPVVNFDGTGGFTSLACTFNTPVELPGNTTFRSDGSTLSFPGVISGTASLTKTGTTALQLSGANTYNGGTIVSGGTVNVSNNQSTADGGWDIGIDSTSATTVNFLSGSTLAAKAATRIRIGNNTGTGTQTQTLNIAGTVTNDGSLYVGRPGVMNVNSGGKWTQRGAASINGQGGYRSALTVNTGGTFTYEGDSGFAVNPAAGSSGPGVLTLAGGTFTTSRGFANTVDSSTATASMVMNSNGLLKLSGDIPELVTTAGSPFLFQLGSGGGTVNTNGFTTTMNGAISDVTSQSGSLTKTGSGTLTLTAENSYSGGTTIASNGGTLLITRPEAIGSGTISIPKTGTLSGTLALAFSGTSTLSNTFAGFNSTTFTGETTVPTIHHLSGDTTISADLTISGTGGNGLYVRTDTGKLRLSGTIRQTVGTIRNLGLGGDGEGLISGDILTGTGGLGLTKDGSGTWTLTGANTYNGATSISRGTLRIGDGGTSGTTGSNGISVGTGASLEFRRSNELIVPNTLSGAGGMVQSGTGRTAVTGSTLPSGSIRVLAGTLALSAPAIGDSSLVEIAGGALLALEYSGTDAVGTLVIDGVPQPSGLWGAPGSGATHVSPRLSGSGLLQVASGPFEAWLDAHPLLTDRSEDGDPDGDGWPNLLEYAFGLDPLSADPRLSARAGDGVVFMEFTRHGLAPGITVIPEWSRDMIGWSAEGLDLDDTAAPVIRVSISSGDESRKFLRLRVTRP